MSTQRKLMLAGGYLLHGLIAGLMMFAGLGKIAGFAPAEVVQKMDEFGLSQQMQLIGWGELITALLLLYPRTLSLGTLLTSGFWGGVICIHMSHALDYTFPSVLLTLTWAASTLRDPATLNSLLNSKTQQETVQLGFANIITNASAHN